MKTCTFTLCDECRDLSAALMRPDRNSDETDNLLAEWVTFEIIEEMDAFLGDVAPLGFAYLSPRSIKFNVEPSKTCEAPGCDCQKKESLGLYLGLIDHWQCCIESIANSRKYR